MRARHVAFKLYYDGSAFHGFQRQPGVKTVESEILHVLASHDCLYGGDPKEALYSAASRTDAGVHALGQVVGFLSTCDPLDTALLINRELRPRVYVWGVRGEAPPEFHARYWAVERTYVYLAGPLSADIFLAEAILSGFRGVRKYPVDSGSPYRRVTRIGVEEWERFVVIKVSGDSFARRQVRRMIGMIMAAARGTYSSYGSVRPAAPERLVLLDVVYPFSFHVPRSLARGLTEVLCGKGGPVHRYLCRLAASLSGAGT